MLSLAGSGPRRLLLPRLSLCCLCSSRRSIDAITSSRLNTLPLRGTAGEGTRFFPEPGVLCRITRGSTKTWSAYLGMGQNSAYYQRLAWSRHDDHSSFNTASPTHNTLRTASDCTSEYVVGMYKTAVSLRRMITPAIVVVTAGATASTKWITRLRRIFRTRVSTVDRHKRKACSISEQQA